MGCPNPPAPGAPNGFLLAASSLGFPPRPLKNPDPDEAFPAFEPNRPPDGAWPKTPAPLACCPNTDEEEEVLLPNPDGCPKLNPEEGAVVVLLPKTAP